LVEIVAGLTFVAVAAALQFRANFAAWVYDRTVGRFDDAYDQLSYSSTDKRMRRKQREERQLAREEFRSRARWIVVLGMICLVTGIVELRRA
jgi:hypothetical protein